MSISAVGSTPVMHRTGSEQAEGPGPDHDGDSDDNAGVASNSAPPMQAPGVGQAVNKTA